MEKSGIVGKLFQMRDEKYAAMQVKILPTVEKDSIIGVRTPELRAFAKALFGDAETESFLKELPHRYFDENQLHAFVISQEKDFDKCIAERRRFSRS